MNRGLVLAAALLALAGCSGASGGQSSPQRAASAELRDAQGQTQGSATLTSRGADSTTVMIRLGMPLTGPHGVHLHQVGRCDPPGFTTAGGHLNPFGRQHGRLNPRGSHAGDLPNLPAGGSLEFTLAVPFDSVMDADGTAIVVHAGPDDEMTDPSGNSGARLLCGVVMAAGGRRTAP